MNGEEVDTYVSADGKKAYIMDSGGLRRLAEDVIALYPDELSLVDLNDVEFAVVEGDKQATYLAKAIKIPAIFRLFIKKKFIILFNALQLESFPDKIDLVMAHELRHVNTPVDGLVSHDTEDFESFLVRHGVAWKVHGKNIVPLGTLRELVPWAVQKEKGTESFEGEGDGPVLN